MSLFRLAFGAGDEVIHGKKTLLRHPRMTDFEEWKALRQKSRSFIEEWEPVWSEDEFSRRAYRQRISVYNERAINDDGHSFYIFDKVSGALVGGLTLSHIRRGVSQSASLGYWMGAPYAGQGYMKDAVTALAEAARIRFGLHRLEAACIPRNERSRHLLLACGFQPEGYAKAYVKIAGLWEDHLLFGLVIGAR